MFGVGGGILIVPALVLVLRFDQKLASGTSLVALGPISVVGMLTYLAYGHIDWRVAVPLAIGMVAGGALGSWLLARLSSLVVTWIFIAVMVVVAVRLFFESPVRGVVQEIGWIDMGLLTLFGVLAGILSGLVGVGGGIIMVPALVVFWGIGDLVAKGASLLAIVPNAVTTSVLNVRRRNADLASGLTVGAAGAVTTVAGATAATWIEPRAGAILFGALLLAVAAQLTARTIRRMRADNDGTD